jgi:ATP-binding cassette subfamily B protein
MDILNHTSSLDLEQMEDLRFQDTLGIVQQNAASVFGKFLTSNINLVSVIFESLFLLILLYRIDPWVVPFFLPIGAVYLWFQSKYIGRKTEMEKNRSTKRRWTRYFTLRVTNQQYIPEVKLLNLAPFLLRKFDDLMKEFILQDRKVRNAGFRIQAFFAVISSSVVTVLLWKVISAVRTGLLTIGDLTVFGGSALRLRRNLDTTIQSLGGLQEDTIYIKHLRILLQTAPFLQSTENFIPSACRGEYRLENVTFQYPGSSQPTLHNISLHIRSGEVIALIGENGSGKTTLVKLLTRLYSPTSGRILLDGRNLDEYDLDYLRRQYSFILQNYGHYEGTVHENIAYGDWPRLIDRPELVEEIARSSGIDPLVRSLPNGYQTILGRMFGEIDLSGGQWQKIAIARAFARNGSILILDEPTSNLDPRSEYEIFNQFRNLAAGRTAILISHRFSTVSMADRIIVLSEGRIVEQGTHGSLLQAGGVYAALFEMQTKQMTHLRKEK